MDEESSNWFVFSDGNNRYYRFKRVPMGWSGACAHFQLIVSGVFNEKDFRSFQYKIKNEPEISQLDYTTAISIYLDDVHLHSKTMKQQYFLIEYILKQATKFNLKLNASKCELITKDVECLGYSLSPSKRVMKLSEPRAKLIQSWNCPVTPKGVLSRLSSLNYFNLVLPGKK